MGCPDYTRPPRGPSTPFSAPTHFFSAPPEIRSKPRPIDQPIGNMDMLIAASALPEKCCNVTHNPAHFGRVPGLSFEDWPAE